MNDTKKMEKKNGFFYGWVIVAACLLLSAASTGLLAYFNALFVEPVTEALAVSRTKFMINSTFSTVTTMIAMPIAGALYQKFSPKILMMIGAFLGAGAHFCFSISSSVGGFYFGAVLAGLGMCMLGGLPISILLSNWFNEKRGFVTGIAFMGSAIVSSLFSPAISEVIQQHGWRVAYRTIGVAILVVSIPTVLILIKVKPADMGLTPYGNHAQQKDTQLSPLVGFTRSEAFKMHAFWLFALAVFLMGVITSSTQQHLIAYWTGKGFTAAMAARIYSVVMLVSLFAKAGVGVVFDKCSARAASAACCLIASGAMVSLIMCTRGWSLLVPAILFGITTTLQVMTTTYLTNKLFGEKDYGSLYGIINTVLFLGVSVGVPLSAAIYDATGKYELVWMLYAIIMLIALVALVVADSLSRRAFKTQLGIIRKE